MLRTLACLACRVSATRVVSPLEATQSEVVPNAALLSVVTLNVVTLNVAIQIAVILSEALPNVALPSAANRDAAQTVAQTVARTVVPIAAIPCVARVARQAQVVRCAVVRYAARTAARSAACFRSLVDRVSVCLLRPAC